MSQIHNLIDFLANHLTVSQILLFALITGGLWVAEKVAYGEKATEKWTHSLSNAFLLLTALPLQVFFNSSLVVLTNFAEKNSWGLAYHLPQSPNLIVKYSVMFILLDFLDYVYHRTMHRVPALWRYHLVHHTETHVDVSTTLREHPGETLLRNCFQIFTVLVFGFPFAILILRQIIQTFTNIFSHTRFRLSSRTGRLVGWFLITPNLHHIHHHRALPYTDSNFGDTFSIWDRLFGTFASMNVNQIRYGLNTHLQNRMHGSDLVMMPYVDVAHTSLQTMALSGLKFCGVLFFAAVCLCMPVNVLAEYNYPDYIQRECPVPMTKIGHGIYRRFGFKVYQATLWAPGPAWDPQKPYLLELQYTRDVSKDVLVDSVVDDIREQDSADDATLDHWKDTLVTTLPAVSEGDVLSGLSTPGSKTKLYLNGMQIAMLDDDKLSHAFFDMWFGSHADHDLRTSLIGNGR